MSSILASLDMSLDDIISKKKTNPDARPTKSSGGGRGAASGAAGPVRKGRTRGGRSQPYSRGGDRDDDLMDVDDDDAPTSKRGGAAAKRRAVTVKTPQGKGGKKGPSILSRLGKASGGSGSDANAGTKILVKNLKFDILEDDVRELFSTVGKVSKAEIVYDRSGRSKGLARVWFAKHSDAEKAIKQYDGRTLDGQAMSITLDSDKNVRNGLFGTALGKSSDEVKFKVNFGDKNESGGRDRERRDRERGRGRGGRGGRGGRSNDGGSKSAADLDNEMDSYMKDA